ncbi:MAG TPA: metal ABC transporter permease [Acidimicrobiales bacterium]|nr:metal ABC transporter permease [Acidimicrobiales bacterium]
MFAYHFMVNAFRAGTIVAVAGGLMGWFMVLRRQTFAGHTLAVVGFPGAAGAVWLGVNAAWGYFGFCGAGALLIAALPRATGGDRSHESAGIGVVQAFGLAAGFLFVSLYHGFLNGVSSLLFGSFLGITDGQVLTLLLVCTAAVVALALAGRPLLFASVDPDVAAARGVPVRAVSAGFLLALGLTVAEISQITGALLVFAVLVMPAAAAQALTIRPGAGLAASVVIAVGITWAALTAAYHSSWPIGFWIATFGFGVYLAASGWRRWRSRR